jgi:hypothetical protein
MLRTPRFLLVTLACLPLAGGLLAGGCGQGEGDRCEIDDDCSTGLVCVLNQGRSDGACRTQITTRQPDAAAPDRMPADAPADTATDTTQSTPDTGAEAGTDGTVDGTTASTPDAGPSADRAVDRAADRGNG